MKILIITDVLWRNDNGVGNSYTNIFGGMKDVEIANICCQEGASENDVSSACFQISESSLIRNIKNRSLSSGKVEDRSEASAEPAQVGGGLSSKIKKSRLQIFFWIRDMIWTLGKWQSAELDSFIDGFAPDLIFAQLQDKLYQNKLVGYVKKRTQKPLMLYVWDDVYSLRQFRLSPLYWIDRFMQRRSIRQLARQCSILYTISAEQKDEYAKSLNVRTELLFKGRDFSETRPVKEPQVPLRMLYTGNLYSGRYKTIARLCNELKIINKDEIKITLDVYSATPLSDREIGALNINGISRFCGKVSEAEVQQIQNEADILLHIEPFTLKGSLLCRLSFSTKLVDYFHKKKCIFAVGSPRCSSMKYLKRYDAAIAAESYDEMRAGLRSLAENTALAAEYAQKAWDCGVKYHRIEDIQGRLLCDFEETVNESCTD